MLTLLTILTLITLASAVSAAYLFGLTKLQSKMIVESKRREKRLYRDAYKWQNVYVKSKGGKLREEPTPPKEEQKARRIVSPSEVIAEIKNPTIKTPSVPKKIETEFLSNVKSYVTTNTDSTPVE